MEPEFSGNTVLVAQSLNPSIFSQLWLVQNGIVTQEDFEDDCVFSPLVVRVLTKSFELLVVPERLKLGFRRPNANHQALLNDVLLKIVTTLPHTPYKAMGMNMTWHIWPASQERFGATLRSLFAVPEVPLGQFFCEENSRFGVYLSKDFFGMRLKLDIKPVKASRRDVVREGVRFSFNFQKDIEQQRAVETLSELVPLWDQAKERAKAMVQAIVDKWKDDC